VILTPHLLKILFLTLSQPKNHLKRKQKSFIHNNSGTSGSKIQFLRAGWYVYVLEKILAPAKCATSQYRVARLLFEGTVNLQNTKGQFDQQQSQDKDKEILLNAYNVKKKAEPIEIQQKLECVPSLHNIT
jgi:hypothetical protein